MRDAQLVAWVGAVTRTPLLKDSTKVLLLDLGNYGTCSAGTVSLPRAEMARRLGIAERHVSARLAAAVSAGYLSRLVRGHKGTTAVYMIAIPNVDTITRPRGARSGREPWRQSGAKGDESKHPLRMDSGTRGGPAEPVDNTACRLIAGPAGVPPVLTQATAEPAHPNGVPNITPTDTDTTADPSAGRSTDPLAALDGATPTTATAHSFLTANGTTTATLTDTGTSASALVVVKQGQNWLQEEGRQRTQARLSTADLEREANDDLPAADLEGRPSAGEFLLLVASPDGAW